VNTPLELAALASKLPDRLGQYAPELLAAHLAYQVDPLLLAAIMDRETLGGTSKFLDKLGPGGRGDKGHGHGLMQIDDRSHPGFLGAKFMNGAVLWADPAFNILYAAKLLGHYIRLFKDEVAGVASYNAGPGNVRKALARPVGAGQTWSTERRIDRVDSVTAGHDYVRDVFARREKFRSTTR
jgi:hypothetical protein